MSRDPELVHKEWLGYVQPVGLVVSIPALLDASAVLNQNYGPEHQRFLSALPQNGDSEPIPEIPDFLHFAQTVLNWDISLLAGAPGSDPVPNDLEVNLENYNETLRPTYALRSLEGDAPWLMLVTVLPTDTNMDEPYAPHDRGWHASPQIRFERLLRQTKVGVGLLVNGREIRLVYAPEKELSGHLTFKLAEMAQVAGRSIFAALQMLLDAERLYSVAEKERLPAILENSRKYQNVVSTKLAEQVVEALYELLRGFQAANDQFKGELLGDVLQRDPDEVYRGLLTTLLRLVFVLYAEDRGLLSTDPIYSNYYSVTGLYERLRADAGRYTDTMDQRYGAWAQLLSLFRLVYSGGSHGAMKIPAREGYLFDPDRYLFLEGRHSRQDKAEIPHVPDGVIYRVLSKLLLLDGERLSYRTLAVEQIGSVYEAIMGFELQVAAGQSIAIKPAKRHGAPTTINLEELLRTPSEKRQKWFTDTTDQKLTGQALDALKAASTIEELLAALDKRIAKAVTPNMVPKGAMIFQPSNERRKSGSHYTPSSLTGPIVEAALEPVLKQLGENPIPEQILNLKVCDPAMGSGAFLVEACRQMGDALAKAWHGHDCLPPIPPDEDEALFAQRVIAQRCLYGVDKNAMAVDLAKLSLWLATLAKNHPFTFLDHSLRHGDSLVGLTRQQIAAFHWQPAGQRSFLEDRLRKDIDRVSHYRQRILAAREDKPYLQLKQELDGAEESLRLAREVGDAVIAAFFSSEKPRDREKKRLEMLDLTERALKDPTAEANGVIEQSIANLRRGQKGVAPFHWQLEFPEVFTADAKGDRVGGFDAIVGNPPFLGGKRISTTAGTRYKDYLLLIQEGTNGNMDLAARFFRRAYHLARPNGTMGLIATNTISQGDTRRGGLRWISKNGGSIYRCIKRYSWPGEAAVAVSIVHIYKGDYHDARILDGRSVEYITAFLFHSGTDDDPATLSQNSGLSFIGCDLKGQGFIFDDDDPESTATSEYHRLVSQCADNLAVLRPYMSGEEINESPTFTPKRWVIAFGERPLDECKRWPELLAIVESKVRPERMKKGDELAKWPWWQFWRPRNELANAIIGKPQILALSAVNTWVSIARVPSTTIFSHAVVLFALDSDAAFAVLQSRIHELWARFFGSSLEDRLRYTPSDCFETFSFPKSYVTDDTLIHVGRTYYEHRSDLMASRNAGMTTIYNSMNDPEELASDIQLLREFQDSMDRAVLDAYGWTDIHPRCEFISDCDDDEEEESDRPRKKKFRYRWPDEIRDEVLARLLELNHQRALEEGQAITGDAPVIATKAKKSSTKKSKVSKVEPTAAPPLFAKRAGEV